MGRAHTRQVQRIPLDRWMHRRIVNSRIAWIVAIAAMVSLAGWRARQTSRWDIEPRMDVRIISIADDLTLTVQAVEPSESPARARLLGVDCQERGRASARQWLEQACKDRRVLLLFDESGRRDAAGRLLVYAYLPDGQLLNERLIAAGHAMVNVQPPCAISPWLMKVQNSARRGRKGMWSMESVVRQ